MPECVAMRHREMVILETRDDFLTNRSMNIQDSGTHSRSIYVYMIAIHLSGAKRE